MDGFLEKSNIRERFKNDPGVLLMQEAYYKKLAEYKKILISDAKKDGLVDEKLNYKLGEVTNMMLDEINKLFDAYVDVRKENGEEIFTNESWKKFFASMNCCEDLVPEKKTGAHQAETEVDTSSHVDKLTIKKESNIGEVLIKYVKNTHPEIRDPEHAANRMWLDYMHENKDNIIGLVGTDEYGKMLKNGMKKVKASAGSNLVIEKNILGLLNISGSISRIENPTLSNIDNGDKHSFKKSELYDLLDKNNVLDSSDIHKQVGAFRRMLFDNNFSVFNELKDVKVLDIFNGNGKHSMEELPNAESRKFFEQLIKEFPLDQKNEKETMGSWTYQIVKNF